jgi:hypothetical protein
MRRKLIVLLLALAAAAGSLGLFTPKSSEAAHCTGFLICCDTGQCYCCPRPCSIQCP